MRRTSLVTRVVAILFIVFAVLMTVNCGKVGDPGSAYMALYCDYYLEDLYFPAMPDYIYEGTYYPHAEGTYYFAYLLYYYGYYYCDGTYTIGVEPGEEGGLLKDGADGADRFYDFYMELYEPYFEYYTQAISMGVKPAKAFKNEPGKEIDLSKYDLGNPEPFSQEISDGIYTFRIEGNGYRLKEK